MAKKQKETSAQNRTRAYPPIGRKKKAAPANGTPDLIKELFQAAVNMRGSIEPADYKRYVLPIVFLRFLSLRYEKRHDELTRLVREKGSEYYTANAKAAKALIEDPDEYQSAGAFVLPKKARWEEILKHAQADDIKVRLDDALEALENAYPDTIRFMVSTFSAIWCTTSCRRSSAISRLTGPRRIETM